MIQSKALKKPDTTEEKIKEAARIVFYRKGYAYTRTRDIAEESGINLALINYYFRSKARLFEIIILETLSSFIESILEILIDEQTSIETKIQIIVSSYIDLIIKEPEIPTFIVSELRNNPNELLAKLPLRHKTARSVFSKQYKEAVDSGIIKEPNPLHFLMNLIGMIVFPFIAKPLLMKANNLNISDFNQLMQERKKRIPIWIKAMMDA